MIINGCSNKSLYTCVRGSQKVDTAQKCVASRPGGHSGGQGPAGRGGGPDTATRGRCAGLTLGGSHASPGTETATESGVQGRSGVWGDTVSL